MVVPKNRRRSRLAPAFDYDDAYACTVEPLKGRDIPEISGEESRKYGRFKVERQGRKPSKEEMERDVWAGVFWVRDSLLFFREGEWREVLSSTIERQEFNWERGRVDESLGCPLRHVMYVDVEANILFIEDERDVLYCSENRFIWFMYQARPEKRPYFGRISKLRKFNLPN